MIQEAYVSFETAKLLKEKGFDEDCEHYYTPEGEFKRWFPNGLVSYLNNQGCETWWWKCVAPTQALAMRWLREKCLMDCFVGAKVFEPQSGKISGYSAYVWYKPKNNHGICCYWVYPSQDKECWDSYEDAVEAAIKYCLTNLI